MSLPFFIPDTSPLFAYSPCSNCAGSGSWTSSYSPRGDGYDQTFHQTSGADGTISLNVTASSLEVRTNRNGGECDARYSIDNGDVVDGCVIPFFPQGHHLLKIQPIAGAQSFQFYGIAGTSPLGAEGSFQNSTMDDTSPSVSYSGQWTQITSKGPIGQPVNATVAAQYVEGGNGFYNGSASISTAAGSAVKLKFTGRAVYVYGMAGPDGGEAEVTMDGALMQTLNMTNPWRAYSALMFFATGLDFVPHEISITNLIPGRQLILDYAIVTNTAKSSGPNLTLIIGTIAGVSAVLLIVSVILYIFLVRRKTRPTRLPKSQPYGFANGFSYRDISPAKASSIDSWRKNATPHTPSSGSTSGSSASNGRFYAAHLQPATGQPAISPGRSPPPEYPDYLPYRGPIEPPNLTPNEEPPAIAGLTASTHGWLAAAITPRSPGDTPRSSPRPTRPVHRPDPIPLRDRNAGNMDEIPLDSYYAAQDVISPASTMSSLGLSGMTTRAMGATRSIARLWPTSVIISGPDSTLPSTLSTATIATPPSAQRQDRDRAVSIESMQYNPTYTTAGHFVSSPDQLLGSGITSASLAAMRERSSPNGSTNRDAYSAASPLRRGVSIKSVKTMRSFFSGFIHGSPAPETPALPSAYTHYDTPAARPDSDIFPHSSISRSNSLAGNGGGVSRYGIARTPSNAGAGGSTGAGGRVGGGGSGEGGKRNKSRGTLGSSGLPPMLRLDAGGENFFIELNPGSPMTVVDHARPESEVTAMPSGGAWRNYAKQGNRI